MKRSIWSILILGSLSLLLAACAGSAAPATPAPPAEASGPATSASSAGDAGKELTVFAAASLTESFTEMAAGFSSKTGGARVTYNFGGSNTLRAQIEQGASADVFASANEKEMKTLVQNDLIAGTPSIFARNRLVVITPKANPAGIKELQDLAGPGLKVVAAGPNVPVGGYTLQMLDKMSADPSYGAGFKDAVMKNVVSQETTVKQVVAKVQLGEGDAGVVYGTDVTPNVAPEVQLIEVPDAFNVVARYPITVLKDAKEPDLAQTFLDYVLSGDGQDILNKYNFIAPE